MLQNYSSWAERNGFADWALAIFWVLFAFVGFQLFAAIILFVLMLASGIEMSALPQMINQNFDLLFIGNTVGQILFLALATFFFSRLQTSKEDHFSFLRFQTDHKTLRFTGLAVLAIICIQPFIWFLGWLNSLMPVPEFFGSLQSQQMTMLQEYITNGDHPLLILFHIAVVPAICEEILFRGYVLRSFQKSWGYIAAIIVSGIIFGMYHLQLTHLLPLAAIGILLGYLTWVSESIIPAMAAHFLNNAASVILVRFWPNSQISSTSSVALPSIWLVVLSVIITVSLIYFMKQLKASTQQVISGTI